MVGDRLRRANGAAGAPAMLLALAHAARSPSGSIRRAEPSSHKNPEPFGLDDAWGDWWEIGSAERMAPQAPQRCCWRWRIPPRSPSVSIRRAEPSSHKNPEPFGLDDAWGDWWEIGSAERMAPQAPRRCCWRWRVPPRSPSVSIRRAEPSSHKNPEPFGLDDAWGDW